MQWLNAALAFSITMLILSMVTSVFVETIHRLFGMRVKGLRLMLGHFFDRVVAGHYADATPEQLETLKNDFMDTMTVNRAPAGTAFKGQISRVDNDQSNDEKLWSWLWQGRRLDHLDVNGFMARLGSSEFGDTVRCNSIGATEDVLKDMAQKFLAFGDESSSFFQRRARLLAVIVAIAVSWGMFVHPFQLFSTYIRSPQVADAVIAMQANTTKEYSDIQIKAEAQKQAWDEAIARHDDAAAEMASQDWRDSVIKADSKLSTLQQVGVPVGWTEERLAASGFKKGSFLWLVPIPIPAEVSDRSIATMLWLVFGGLLIGLGGPFWYQIVNSLTNIKALGGGAKDQSKADTPLVGNTENSQPQTPIEHFKAAAAGRDAVTGGSMGDMADEKALG